MNVCRVDSHDGNARGNARAAIAGTKVVLYFSVAVAVARATGVVLVQPLLPFVPTAFQTIVRLAAAAAAAVVALADRVDEPKD